MTRPNFQKIAKELVATFYRMSHEHLTDAEREYLRLTPLVRRNLERKLYAVFAHTFQSDKQLFDTPGLNLEDPQSTLRYGLSTETPLSEAIPQPNPPPKKEAHP